MSLRVLVGLLSTPAQSIFRGPLTLYAYPRINEIVNRRFSSAFTGSSETKALVNRAAPFMKKQPTMEEYRREHLMSFDEYRDKIEKTYPDVLNHEKFSGLDRISLLREGYDSYVGSMYRENVKNLFDPPPNPLIF
jgi:hypothetical protein